MMTAQCAGLCGPWELPGNAGESRAKRSATGLCGPLDTPRSLGRLSGLTSRKVSHPCRCMYPPTQPTTLSGAPQKLHCESTLE